MVRLLSRYFFVRTFACGNFDLLKFFDIGIRFRISSPATS